MTDIIPASPEAALYANLAAARSGATRRNYEAAWRAFQDFAGPALPADPKTVALYLSGLGERAKPSTVRLHAAAIAAVHKDRGFESPTKHPGVKRALAGHANRAGAAPKQASPIDAEAYQRIAATAMKPRVTRGGRTETDEEAQRRGLVDTCLIGLMRDALLRRSEAAALHWRDLERQRDGSGRVLIRRSKTDQTGAGAVRYVSPALTEALLALRTGTDAGDGDPIFGLSPSQICRRIAAACAQAGLEGNFSGHSPRVGMAQDLARAGVSLPALMQAGRWKSPETASGYVRNIEEGRGAVATYYAQVVECSK